MQVSAIEGHRIWAASYDSMPNPLLALEGRLLPELLGPVACRRVVDVGCGTGRWAARLVGDGAEVIGIDFCAEMLERAPSHLRSRLVVADGRYLPVADGVADLAVCSFAADYFADLGGALQEMARVMKTGGRLVMSDLDPAGVRAGWTRSFRAGGVVYEMEHFGYSLEQIRCAARGAGLEAESELHAHLGAPERALFEATGNSGRFLAASAIPAVWMGSWRKA